MNKKLKLTVDLPSFVLYSDVNKGNYLNREREYNERHNDNGNTRWTLGNT